MKKLISLLCVFALVLALIPAAFAEWDLSDLTFDDLIALRAQTQREMMERGEYEEVEVPQGVYRVGEDIPDGSWTIKCGGQNFTSVSVGDKLKENGADVVFPPKASAIIYNTSSIVYDPGDLTEWTVTLLLGDYVVVDATAAVFVTYTGKPSLGFK